MLHLFQKHPYHLFRYGLKHDSRKNIILIDGKAVLHPYLTGPMCLGLHMLMCHPIWNGNMALLRYVLQVAVMHRVPGHIEPVGAMTFTNDLEEIIKSISDVQMRRKLVADYYERLGPEATPEIRHICEALKKTVKKDPPSSGADGLSAEQKLFLLQPKDTKAVINALDSRSRETNTKTCVAYLESYRSRMEGGRHGRFPPVHIDTVKEWKKAAYLAVKRNWIASTRRWCLGVEGPFVMDADPDDGYPIHLNLGPVLGNTRDHVDVFRGAIWPLLTEDPPDADYTDGESREVVELESSLDELSDEDFLDDTLPAFGAHSASDNFLDDNDLQIMLEDGLEFMSTQLGSSLGIPSEDEGV
ncbi:hypothetical protein C8A00DRAFT_12975 [Chaetomidium leptoderma]|uniref:Uncharacterized protein n=1 Tax=Chaetomidium leptoderma TaxID=669021 RepID=A0AAN6ZZM7_9PEZI|nr:hypothetical protein C8A00DRAFT_12975 [Chaetomidium leptoderma]